MKKISVKEVAVPSVVLLLIASLVTALLAVTNVLTKDRIEQLSQERAVQTRMIVLPDAVEFGMYKTNENVYVGYGADGSEAGYVITTVVKGYGGDVSVMTGISADGTVMGTQVLEHNETVGLGANVEKLSFTDQFKGKTSGDQFAVTKDGGNIDAVTGATISSRAVTNAVSEAMMVFNEIKGGAR